MHNDSVASQNKRFDLCRSAASVLLLFLFTLTVHSAIGDYQTVQISLAQPLIIKWRYASDRMSNLTPATDGNKVYVPFVGGILVALNGSDGQLRWKADAGGEFSSAPVTDERSLYAATQYHEAGDKSPVHGTLRALSKETGVTLWMRTLPAPLRGSLVAGPNAIFGGSADGRVYAFDKRTGLTLWINQYAESFSGHPLVSGNSLYIGSEAGTLFVLEQATGKTAWHYRTRGPIGGQAAVLNGVVYFGSGDGYVYAFSEPRSKLLWRRRTGAAVQAVAVVDNGLVVASLDNFAYFLSLNKGALVWRRQLPGRISAPPLIAADGILFMALSTDSAIVLGPKDGKAVNTLPIDEENTSSAGPIAVEHLVLLATAHGLLAFGPSTQTP